MLLPLSVLHTSLEIPDTEYSRLSDSHCEKRKAPRKIEMRDVQGMAEEEGRNFFFKFGNMWQNSPEGVSSEIICQMIQHLELLKPVRK